MRTQIDVLSAHGMPRARGIGNRPRHSQRIQDKIPRRRACRDVQWCTRSSRLQACLASFDRRLRERPANDHDRRQPPSMRTIASGRSACAVQGVALSAIPSSRVLTVKTLNGVSGFGVSGGASGNEIDIGETLRVEIGQARNVKSIKFLFLFNGPGIQRPRRKGERDCRRHRRTRFPSATVRTTPRPPGAAPEHGHQVRRHDLRRGTGCFIVTDPFPAAVSQLDFGAVQGGHALSRHRHQRIRTMRSVPSTIEIADRRRAAGLHRRDGMSGRPARRRPRGLQPERVQAQNPGGSTEAIVIPVDLARLPVHSARPALISCRRPATRRPRMTPRATR